MAVDEIAALHTDVEGRVGCRPHGEVKRRIGVCPQALRSCFYGGCEGGAKPLQAGSRREAQALLAFEGILRTPREEGVAPDEKNSPFTPSSKEPGGLVRGGFPWGNAEIAVGRAAARSTLGSHINVVEGHGWRSPRPFRRPNMKIWWMVWKSIIRETIERNTHRLPLAVTGESGPVRAIAECLPRTRRRGNF